MKDWRFISTQRKVGMFAIFFPEDAHAPGVTPDGVRKVIVKVRVK